MLKICPINKNYNISVKSQTSESVNNESKKMGTGGKILCGICAVAALTAVTFAGIRMHKASQIKKNLKKVFNEITYKDGEYTFNDVLAKIDTLSEKGIVKRGDKVNLLSNKMTKEMYSEIGHNATDIPENAFIMTVQSDGKIAYNGLIVPKGYDESFKDNFFEAWNIGNIIEIPIG